MDNSGLQDAPAPDSPMAAGHLTDQELLIRFESLGGSGHGSEFGLFQNHFGVERDGLLRWADLGGELLMDALENDLGGVGDAANTIMFVPNGNDEWWSKDKRYWMAMRSHIKAADMDEKAASGAISERITFLRRKLIEDLRSGEKIFVFRDMFRNLTEKQVSRLHRAVRRYGNATLLYVRYSDDGHPAGSVEEVAPGLLVGYMLNFAHSNDNRYIGPCNDAWLAVCRRAWQLHASATEAEKPVEPVTSPVPAPRARRPRQIVMIGNCQMQAMMQLYQKFVAGRTGDKLRHIPSYADLTDEGRSAIEQADVVVEQLLDLKPKADTDGVSTTTGRLYIPMVTAAFLWPFAGQPHPKNAACPFLAGGPYGGEASDSYLNRLIMSGADAEEAVEAYVNLDVRKRVNLDRLFELVLDRQRSRDESTGYNIGDVIESHFRTEQIFLSPYHPNTRVSIALATRFFEQLGAEQADIERMRTRTNITPFPKGELPIHPAVASHFGLTYIAPGQRYRFMNEGLFTFREYALRYMRYEWNDALEEGMSLSHNREYGPAVARLRQGLERSPQSAAGHNALSHVLKHTGSNDEAIEAQRRAVEIEPENAAYITNLGNLQRERGQLADAEATLRKAVEANPFEQHYHVLLAHVLRQRGKHDEATASICKAIELDPHSSALRMDHANALEAKGDNAGAAAALEQALALEPDSAKLRNRLAQLLLRTSRSAEALEAAQKAVDADPAASTFRMTLSECLLREGRKQEALTQAYVAAVKDPDSGPTYAHLGGILRQTGDLEAAEQAYRRAISLAPRNAHFRHELSTLLSHMKRLPEAIAAARDATEQDPGNPNRQAHLAALLLQANNLAEARTAQARAVEIAPNVITLRLVLSDLFARDGKLQEALAEARLAVQQEPGNAQALGHLAHINQLMGDIDEAEENLAKAIGIAPTNDHLRRQYNAIIGRRQQQSVA